MATQPNQQDWEDDFSEDEPDLDLGDDAGDDNDDETDDEDDDRQDEGEPGTDDDEQDVIGWGKQAVETQDEPEGIRNLRTRLREIERENKSLKAAQAPKVDEVGPKPDMDDYWDKPEQFEKDLLEWRERQRSAEQRQTEQQQAARRQQERWEAQSRDFDAGYADLRVTGKDAALAWFEDTFTDQQRAFIVKAAGKAAPSFVVALRGNEAKTTELQELAKEESWAEFIAAAAVMAKEVNVQRRKPSTAPERRHATEGNSGGTGAGHRKDAKRERLEREADASGDYSALVRYDTNMRKKTNG